MSSDQTGQTADSTAKKSARIMKINRIKSNYIILILLLMCLFLCTGCGG